MTDMENEWDKLLHIKTTGRDDTISDLVRYPYEPTDYSVLEQLAGSGYINKSNTVVDYGCGKGRVSFFLSSQTKCHTIGIEYNPRLYQRACSNQETAPRGNRVTLLETDATDFVVPEKVDRCFFFNPFSVEILRTVLENLQKSCQASPREILLIFYYPSPSYTEYLASVSHLTLIDTIDCRPKGKYKDKREKLMIFRLDATTN
ncbi:Methyltransferase domain-containing protein [Selenomonas ruminantium]|uniref:Methyltransferase domain-containing protein n=1 Tax=Selenomonas ruminantium TaxID=971 RepID=A0A1M6RG37_SELRU|nr:class I SAM-dependent methyltransferase [Selenomonas ruminantium]SHK31327.1 Methyltransferase domain-containing protein [Selenomonas ruminantium]